MRKLRYVVGLFLMLSTTIGHTQVVAKFDPRLTVHTILREDIFAGFLGHDMERFARGEQNMDALLTERPADRANLLAWQGFALLYRSVLALESGNQAEYTAKYKTTTDLFAEAKRTPHQGGGVEALIGGSYVLFADRLASKDRSDAWGMAYSQYQDMWKAQGNGVANLPTHLKGELLSGMAQTAQRTGRADEAQANVEKILELMPGTPYATVAKRWKDSPASASGSSIVCQSCHEAGRLAARKAALPD